VEHAAAAAALAGGHLHLDDALPAGLAAELAHLLNGLALPPELGAAGIACVGQVVVPEVIDPQNPACLYALIHYLDHTLPALVSGWLGHPYVRPDAGCLPVWILRKGCYLDAAGPQPGIEVWLGLTGLRWPAAWGGHLEILDEAGKRCGEVAPGLGSLELIRGRVLQVPLLTRQVQALWIRTVLVPC